MERLKEFLKRVLHSEKYLIEKEYFNEFRREIGKENYTRLAAVSVPLFALEFCLLFFEESLFYVGNVILWFVILCGIFLPFIWYGRIKIKTISFWYVYIVQYAFATLCITFGASLALVTQARADLIHMYLMMVFFTAAFLYMRPFGSAILYVVTFTHFILKLPNYVMEPEARFIIILNTAASNVAAWIMSNVLWRSRISVFVNKNKLFQQNSRLLEINKKDMMTELYNHESSLIILENEISRANDLDYPLCLIIADIDDFKKVNDNHGHLMGDSVIKEIAKIISENVRLTDFVGRYGGEEFIIIMPHTTLKYANIIAERIRSKINSTNLCKEVSVTISGGISQYDGEDINGFIRVTDQKLYIAKTTGKNRFESQNIA